MPKKARKNLTIAIDEDQIPADFRGTPKHGLAGTPLLPGLTGLANMGNTCYLNSSLQCLSHTVPMAEYFLNECWRGIVQDKQCQRELIGKTNSTGSALCSSYTDLIQQLWMGDRPVVRPNGM